MYQSNKKQMGDEQTQADYIICYLKKSMGQWENQIGNQKIPQDKEKCKHITTLRKCSKRSSKREVHSDTGLPWEIRKTSNKPSNSLLKRIRIRASIPPRHKRDGCHLENWAGRNPPSHPVTSHQHLQWCRLQTHPPADLHDGRQGARRNLKAALHSTDENDA